MLSREWTDRGLVFSVPNGVLEDFTVVRDEAGRGQFVAFYCAGPNLQDQRLHHAFSPTPVGPWSEGKPCGGPRNAHTRLYRANVSRGMLVSAVWPGLPKAGLWLFTEMLGVGYEKQLLIAPKDGTLYSVAAVNPCTYWDGEHWNVYFEGRAELVHGRCEWRLFHAVCDRDFREVTVFDDPLWDGANPSVLEWEGTVYLYYSKWNGGGFDTHCATQVKR